jgi:hypothetical protein
MSLEQVCFASHQDSDVKQLIISPVHTEITRWLSDLEEEKRHFAKAAVKATEDCL